MAPRHPQLKGRDGLVRSFPHLARIRYGIRPNANVGKSIHCGLELILTVSGANPQESARDDEPRPMAIGF
jgi:hypothetical protein